MDNLSTASKLGSILDIMEGKTKDGRAGVGAPDKPRPNHYEGVAMSSVSGDVTRTRQQIAVEYLKLTREHLERSVDLRTHYVKLARAEGMTNADIGEVLGVSEARIRQIAKAE